MLIVVLFSVSIKTSFVRDSSAVFPEDIDCNGNETTLSNCSTSAIKYHPTECRELAGVICEGLLCTVHYLIQVLTLYVFKTQLLVFLMV